MPVLPQLRYKINGDSYKPVFEYAFKCEFCGKKFRSNRSHAQTCSGMCRTALWRLKKKLVQLKRKH